MAKFFFCCFHLLGDLLNICLVNSYDGESVFNYLSTYYMSYFPFLLLLRRGGEQQIRIGRDKLGFPGL